jgi:hypothetical protein
MQRNGQTNSRGGLLLSCKESKKCNETDRQIPVEGCHVREGKKRSIQDQRGIGGGGPGIHAQDLRHIWGGGPGIHARDQCGIGGGGPGIHARNLCHIWGGGPGIHARDLYHV